MKCLGVLAAAVLAGVSLFDDAAHAGSASVAYQIDPAHDGQLNLFNTFTPPLHIAWSRDLGGYVSHPIAANGLVFVAVSNTLEDGAKLYALNLNTGATVWMKPLGGFYNWLGITYDAGRIIVVNFNGLAQAFKADHTGAPLWANYFEYQGGQQPAVGGGKLYLDEIEHATAANTSDGSLAWTAPIEGESSAAAADSGVFLGFPCNYYRLAQKTGQVTWHYTGNCYGGGDVKPIYYDGQVFVRDCASGGYIFDAKTGDKSPRSFWSDQAPSFWKSPSGTKSIIEYIASSPTETAYLKSVDLDSGATNWTFRGDGTLATAPVTINGMIAVGSGYGQVYLLDAASGNVVSSTAVPGNFIENGEMQFACEQVEGLDRPWSGFGGWGNTLLAPASNMLFALKP